MITRPTFIETPYFHTGRASELTGKDRALYRAFEILPGALAWLSILAVIAASHYIPRYAGYFIIAFDIYWFLKTVYLSIHLRKNWKALTENIERDWPALIKALPDNPSASLSHLVILSFSNESFDVIDRSVGAIAEAYRGDSKMFFVLASEARVGKEAKEIGNKIREKYQDRFDDFLVASHPDNISGEMIGKGSNTTYAARQAKALIIDKRNLSYEKVLVSAFDSDTVVYPDYFLCVVWHFWKEKDPCHASYQPIPLYNNNMWRAPILSRVVAFTGTFWQMVQQERPEKLVSFSSHTLCLSTLVDIDFWQTNMVSEDSRIFWNAFMAYDGNYRVVPLSYPISLNANAAPGFWQTIANIYKQQRRWAWGTENLPYILMAFVKNKKISLGKKIQIAFSQLEGYWSLSTNPLFIFLLGWLPLVLSNEAFRSTVFAQNLSPLTRDLMILCSVGFIFSGFVAASFIPPAPEGTSLVRKFLMYVQWILVPFTIMFLGAIPGLDAQTRLMLGSYMGFWITPKHS